MGLAWHRAPEQGWAWPGTQLNTLGMRASPRVHCIPTQARVCVGLSLVRNQEHAVNFWPRFGSKHPCPAGGWLWGSDLTHPIAYVCTGWTPAPSCPPLLLVPQVPQGLGLLSTGCQPRIRGPGKRWVGGQAGVIRPGPVTQAPASYLFTNHWAKQSPARHIQEKTPIRSAGI
ncbi:unnamed protein product [Natator depressus]